MTARFCVAMFYGLSAAVIAIVLQVLPADAVQAPAQDPVAVAPYEILLERTGHAEIDDLPAYLTSDADALDLRPAPIGVMQPEAQFLAGADTAILDWAVLGGYGALLILLACWARRHRWT